MPATPLPNLLVYLIGSRVGSKKEGDRSGSRSGSAVVECTSAIQISLLHVRMW